VPGVSDRATEASVCGLPADMVTKCTGRCVRLLDYSGVVDMVHFAEQYALYSCLG
jgi:hypothetical protein